MLLKRLEIRNCRKLKQVDIDFHGPGLTILQGPNQSGKSSIAQSIALSFEGTKAYNPGMISRGQEQAEVIAYTDNGLQIRTIIKDNVKQTVSQFDETAKKYVAVSGGVRAFLDSIRSGLELPWAMRDLTDAKIIEILKERTGVSQRIAEIDAAVRDKETARRDVGRDKTKLGHPPIVEPAEHPEKVDSLQEERENANKYLNSEASLFNTLTSRVKERCNFSSVEDIAEFRQTVDEAEKEAEKRLSFLKQNIGKTYTRDDLKEIEKELQDWMEAERTASEYDKYLEKTKEIEDLTARYDALTAEIEGFREERNKVLADMRLEVKGLQIGEDNMLYHNGNLRGITDTNKIGNWSTAESVQVFFQIAVRFCGELKVLVVDNAESLDEKTTDAISKWAEKAEYLVILLKVASVPEDLEEGIIYLKEGEVVTK